MDHNPQGTSQSRSQPTRHITQTNHRRELRVLALLGLLINRAMDCPHCPYQYCTLTPAGYYHWLENTHFTHGQLSMAEEAFHSHSNCTITSYYKKPRPQNLALTNFSPTLRHLEHRAINDNACLHGMEHLRVLQLPFLKLVLKCPQTPIRLQLEVVNAN